MKAAVYDRYGGPEGLEVRDVPTPQPAAGEVLVQVVAAAVNPVDWKMMRGDLRVVTGRNFPRYIGADFSGTVTALGFGVVDFKVGDEVFGNINPIAGGRGGMSEQVVVRSSEIALKPAKVSFADAATLPVAGVSALDCLDRLGEARSGQRLLVIGAAGGVGAFIVQLARNLGLHVTAVCRGSNSDWARQLGADQVIAYDREELFSGGARYDLIIDAAAVSSFGRCRDALTPRGIYVNTMPTPRNYLDAWRTRFFSATKARVLIAQVNSPRLALLARMMSAEKLKSVVVERFPLSDVRQAYARSVTGHVRGKIVVEVR